MLPPWLVFCLLFGPLGSVHCNQSRKFDLNLLNLPRSKSNITTELRHSTTTSVITRLKRRNETTSKGHFDVATFQKRSKRSVRRNKACEMLIAIDEPLYRTYDGNIDELTKLSKDYVKELNIIYHRTIFNEGGPFQDIYFRIKEIRVLFDFCVECNETQTGYLTEFTKMNTASFCLAHVFTYRDFPAGVQGLAWKATMCRRRHNTGFTTFLNHQVRATREESIMTFAHEIGHNVGAQHDQDVGCPEGYIMSESGSKRHFSEHQFSSCSIYNMTNELNGVLRHYRGCFVDKDENDEDNPSFCGNYIVEGEEECDCGLSYMHCDDPCCYAAQIDPRDLSANESAIPCRQNKKHSCLHPFDSIWRFGFLAPWLTILVVGIISAILLFYDWKHDRKCYAHVTQPKELIRSETTEQMRKRMERKQNSVESNRLMDGNIYVLNVATPTQRGEPTRGSGRGARPLDQPPPIPPPPPSIPPPPPPPKDYPSAPPFVGKPPTSQTVNRLKSQFEQRH